MGVNIKNNKFVIKAKLKDLHFGLPIEVNNSPKHEIDFIVKQNYFLAEQTIKPNLCQVGRDKFTPPHPPISFLLVTQKR